MPRLARRSATTSGCRNRSRRWSWLRRFLGRFNDRANPVPTDLSGCLHRPGEDFQLVVSRRFNAIALGAVAADVAAKYAHTCRADFLVGLIVFVVLTVRTLLILGLGKIEENTFRRRVTCMVAFLVCAVASTTGQFYLGDPIRPLTLLPLVGVGLGCLGESSNNMIVRRRCVLAMGCVMA